MNFGLVGWGCTTGNGGMNSDLASFATWVSHWLIPEHPKLPNHKEYLDRARKAGTTIIETTLKPNKAVIDSFLDAVDALIYIEHPCYKDDGYNIVLEAKKKNKIVVGIPMWEWWPERKNWSLKTDILIAVTNFTKKYLDALSNTLHCHGYIHNWHGNVISTKWGVNLECFKFKERKVANKFVFINGNGGHKLRKASDIVSEVFSRKGAPPLLVYSQQKEKIAQFSSPNIEVVYRNFSNREDVYFEGDVFLFPSYWEGLCHGVYEAQAVGGIVVTSSQPPMNECGSPYLVGVSRYEQEDLSGKKILKSVPDSDDLYNICRSLYRADIRSESQINRNRIESEYDLRANVNSLYYLILSVI